MATYAANVQSLGVTGLGVPPQSLIATSSVPGSGNWVAPTKGRALVVIGYAGSIAASGTVTIKLQQASDANGTGAADVSGYTTLLTWGDTDDNLVKVAEITQDTLATIAASAKPFIALVCTTGGGATVVCSAAVCRLDPQYVG